MTDRSRNKILQFVVSEYQTRTSPELSRVRSALRREKSVVLPTPRPDNAILFWIELAAEHSQELTMDATHEIEIA